MLPQVHGLDGVWREIPAEVLTGFPESPDAACVGVRLPGVPLRRTHDAILPDKQTGPLPQNCLRDSRSSSHSISQTD